MLKEGTEGKVKDGATEQPLVVSGLLTAEELVSLVKSDVDANLDMILDSIISFDELTELAHITEGLNNLQAEAVLDALSGTAQAMKDLGDTLGRALVSAKVLRAVHAKIETTN